MTGLRYAYNTNRLGSHRLGDALSFLADTGYSGVALTLDVHHLDPLADDALAAAEAAVAGLIERDGAVTIASLRDALGLSRRYAQAYLEHCDAARLTLRVGDTRVLRRKRS